MANANIDSHLEDVSKYIDWFLQLPSKEELKDNPPALACDLWDTICSRTGLHIENSSKRDV